MKFEDLSNSLRHGLCTATLAASEANVRPSEAQSGGRDDQCT